MCLTNLMKTLNAQLVESLQLTGAQNVKMNGTAQENVNSLAGKNTKRCVKLLPKSNRKIRNLKVSINNQSYSRWINLINKRNNHLFKILQMRNLVD